MITKLYKITASGDLQVWAIHRYSGVGKLLIIYGRLNGVLQEKWEDVKVNQSGRSLPEQVNLIADSRINSQINKGYFHTIEEARVSHCSRNLGDIDTTGGQ